jgi:hypothetical protein
MNHLNQHPIFATLANSAAELIAVNIDDQELERIMNKEAGILGVRVMTTIPFDLAVKPVAGTITARIRTLLGDVEKAMLQDDFRSRVADHPAYDHIVRETREAYDEGKLSQLFDKLEGIGVIVGFDKKTSKVSFGLNAMKMNTGIREHTKMYSSKDKRSLDFVNSDHGSLLGAIHPNEELVGVVGTMTTTYYLTFDV